jgi:hypothetical protein
LFPRKIGTCKTDEKQPAPGRSGPGSLITFARDPGLCYETIFQSISHGLRDRLTQKQGENEYEEMSDHDCVGDIYYCCDARAGGV